MYLRCVKEIGHFLELVYHQFNPTSPIYADCSYKSKPYELVGRPLIFPSFQGLRMLTCFSLFQVPARFYSLVSRLQDAANDYVTTENASVNLAILARRGKALAKLQRQVTRAIKRRPVNPSIAIKNFLHT